MVTTSFATVVVVAVVVVMQCIHVLFIFPNFSLLA